MTDTYTRFVLTIIALSLGVIALRGAAFTPAYATDTLDCRMTISSFREELKVKIEQVYGQPGSSSTRPLHVKVVN